MRRGECCGLQWGDINWQERSIHIQRNVVKITGEDIIVKETKTVAGDRYVYFSLDGVPAAGVPAGMCLGDGDV